jgi:integrin alpha FG-GAP repeat containing protein 1
VQTCQLAQQAYQSLTTATNIIGLGRTNNYIEDLFIGVTRHTPNIASYQGIIPNSAVVVAPHQEPNQGPESWRLELYMNPSSTTGVILIVLTVTLTILAIVISILDTIERVLILNDSEKTKSSGSTDSIPLILMPCNKKM